MENEQESKFSTDAVAENEAEQQLISQSLERLADNNTDIFVKVHAAIAAKMPNMHAQMSHMDDRMRGRMLDQIVNLLLGDVHEDYLTFEVCMHHGYGAKLEEYQCLLDNIKDIIASELGSAWTSVQNDAWNSRIRTIVSDISSVLTESEIG